MVDPSYPMVFILTTARVYLRHLLAKQGPLLEYLIADGHGKTRCNQRTFIYENLEAASSSMPVCEGINSRGSLPTSIS